MQFLTSYLIAAVLFLVIDAIWLGLIARRFYAGQLGALMRARVDFAAAGAFYLLYPAGLTMLAILPALAAEAGWQAAALGAMVGLTAYGTYNLTNMATLRGWPAAMSYVDMVWGTALSAVVAHLAVIAAKALGAG